MCPSSPAIPRLWDREWFCQGGTALQSMAWDRMVIALNKVVVIFGRQLAQQEAMHNLLNQASAAGKAAAAAPVACGRGHDCPCGWHRGLAHQPPQPT